jgi:hypothetical protein
MFKSGSSQDELFRSMDKSLVENQTENAHGFGKLAKAADYLNEAATIFEQAGMSSEAAQLTDILLALVKDVQ